MKDVLNYLYLLFLDDNQPLKRHHSWSAFSLLWFCNLLSLIPLVSGNLVQLLLAQKDQVESLTSFSIFSQYWGLMTLSFPWVLLVFSGSILLCRRLFLGRLILIVRLLFGCLLFLFFRSLIVLPLLGSTMTTSLSFAHYEVISQALIILMWILSLSFLSGLIIIISGFSRTSKISEEKLPPKQLDRFRFNRRFLWFSLLSILALLCLGALYYLLDLIGINLSNTLIIIISVIFLLISIIIGLTMIIRRVRHSVLNFSWLWLPPISLFVSAMGLWISFKGNSLSVLVLGSIFMQIGITSLGLLFLLLMILPGKKDTIEMTA